MSGDYLRGIAALDNRMIVVVDIDAILDAAEAVMTMTNDLPTQSSQEIR